jgi:hypothetical protein
MIFSPLLALAAGNAGDTAGIPLPGVDHVVREG